MTTKKIDFGLFFLLDTIRPVCLPQYNQNLPGGTQCWISGWGYTQPDAGTMLLQHSNHNLQNQLKASRLFSLSVQSPDTLKEAPVPIISPKTCNSSCMYNGGITPRMLCAGYTEGKVDACQVRNVLNIPFGAGVWYCITD